MNQAFLDALRHEATREARQSLSRYRRELDRLAYSPYVTRSDRDRYEQNYRRMERELGQIEARLPLPVRRESKPLTFYARKYRTWIIAASIVAAVVLTMFVLFIMQLATNPLR